MIDINETRKLMAFLDDMIGKGIVTRAYNLALQLEKNNIVLEKCAKFIPDDGYYKSEFYNIDYLDNESRVTIVLRMEYINELETESSFEIPHEIIESEDINIVYNYLIEEMRKQMRENYNKNKRSLING